MLGAAFPYIGEDILGKTSATSCDNHSPEVRQAK